MNKIKFLKYIGIFCVIPIYAQTNLWHGTIGKKEIYFYLPCDITQNIDKDNNCGEGRYFYTNILQDIQLDSALPETKTYKFNLQVKHSMDDNSSYDELFELNYIENELRGFWKNKFKRLKVVLKPFTPKKKMNDTDNEFENIREEFFKYKQDKIQTFKNLKKDVVWIKELHTSIRMFRLGNGFASSIRNKLNTIFDEIQKDDATVYLTCASPWAYGSGVEYLNNKITYLSDNLLGYSVSVSYFCGGAHPDFGTIHDLFDIHTGKKYKLEDIIKFTKNVPKENDENWEVREKYDDIVSVKLRELAFKANQMELKTNTQLEKETYDPYDISYWKYMDWSYEKEGIRFFLTFSSAYRCFRGDSYLIPFKLLKPYKNKNFPYAFGNKNVYIKK